MSQVSVGFGIFIYLSNPNLIILASNAMTSIETKEIKGVTLKTLITIIGATVAIVTALFMFKDSINSSINNNTNAIQQMQAHQTYNDSLNSIKIKEMDLKIEQVRNDVLQNRKVIQDSK